MHIQYTRKSQKWSPKTSQSHQNEVPRGTQSRQNNENSEKVKSNEHINIYSVLEGLGHQNSPEFPCRNQQKTWLQSKCDLGLFKSEKISKSDPERSPMGDPKSPQIAESQFWSRLSAPLHPMITQITKKWCPKTQNAWKLVPQDLEKSINLWNKISEICFKRCMQFLHV